MTPRSPGVELLETLGERMSCPQPLGLYGNPQPGRVGIWPTTLVPSSYSFLKRVQVQIPESGHGTGLGGQSG